MNNKTKRFLLGFSVDDDGHLRVTKSDGFYLAGGTKESHDALREKALRFYELFEQYGKTLEDASYEEIHEIAQEAGFKNFTRLIQ